MASWVSDLKWESAEGTATGKRVWAEKASWVWVVREWWLWAVTGLRR